AWLVNPEARAILGPRTLITDLRTGAMVGGSGEQAIATAAAAQMSRFYDLPNSSISGATESKIPDAQSGYEKALTVSLAAHAGCNLISQSCGMQASLMGCALESYVIDNDMLGSIMRSVRGVELNEESLAREVIAEVANGEGHYLGTSDTFARMNTDFLYPDIADRQSVDEWVESGSLDMRERAIVRAREILAQHHPAHISDEVDAAIRRAHEIRLPREMLT
ncbi:MAG: trimethylamine methyltransferase family protein, partial [Hyphomicrobiaceae bacterium]